MNGELAVLRDRIRTVLGVEEFRRLVHAADLVGHLSMKEKEKTK